jgi:hypothetical protein
VIEQPEQTAMATRDEEDSLRASHVAWRLRLLGFLGALLAVPCLLVLAETLFGSAAAAVAWLGGDRLLVVNPRVTFSAGRVDEHRELVFVIRNVTGSTVTIIGANSNCTCVASKDLPKTISPRETASLHVDLHLTRNLSNRDNRLSFYTDYDKKRQFSVTFSGVVSD